MPKTPKILPESDARDKASFEEALWKETVTMVWQEREGREAALCDVEGRVRGTRGPRAAFVVVSDTLKYQAGYEAGLDRALFKGLGEQQLAPTGTLDLHGHRADAFIHLFDWLSEAARQGERVVTVVTGKGRGHGELKDMGVLKSQICEWLQRHPLVMAFKTAAPRDGGAGAIYVLLRKR